MTNVNVPAPAPGSGQSRWSLRKTPNEITAAIMGAAIAALIGGVTCYFMWQANATAREALLVQKQQLELDVDKSRQERDSAKQEAETFKRLVEAAPTTFTNNLDQLINQAVAETQRKEGPSQLLSASQALVSARKSLASSLDVIQSRLDGDIDELEKELSKPKPDETRVAFLLDVLRRKWPTKKAEIELAIRKIETELGLVPSLPK